MRKTLTAEEIELKGVRKYNSHKRKTWDRRLFIFSFLVLPIASFIIFYVVVNFEAFFYSFMSNEGGYPHFDPTYNFTTIYKWLFGGGDSSSILSGSVLKECLLNVLLLNVVGICLGLPISVIFGYFLYRKIKGHKFFRFIIYLPSIISSAAMVMLYKQIIGTGGPIDEFFNTASKFGGQPYYTNGVAIYFLIFYCFIFGFGTNMIVINGAMNSMNKEMIEASELDGCNWFQELVHVISPSIWPTISTILIMCAAGFLGATGPILAYSGLGQTPTSGTFTFSFLLYYLIHGSGSIPGQAERYTYLASAIGLCMTLISFPLALIVKRVCYGKEK